MLIVLLQGQTIDDIPNSVLDDACQLVKANSIMGNKMNDIDIVYTMWSNLKKTAAMEVIWYVSFNKNAGVSGNFGVKTWYASLEFLNIHEKDKFKNVYM